MQPHSVLHKRNGHRQLPGPGVVSPGELLNLVHSAPGQLSDLSPDLLKFAVVAQSERPTADNRLAANDGRFPPAVARALTRSQEAFERGELPEIQAALEALRAQAALAADVIARLTDVVGSSDTRPYGASDRCLVNVNRLLVQALDLLNGASPRIAAVSTRLDPDLPSVPGDPNQLTDVLQILLLALSRVSGSLGEPRIISLETAHRDGVLRGEKIVRVSLTTGNGPDGGTTGESADHAAAPEAPSRIDLERAARIVKEHGGILAAAGPDRRGLRFTVELPAV